MTRGETIREFSPEELAKFHSELQAIARAVRGAPTEGNIGVLQRLDKVERKVTLLMVVMVPAVTVGTAVGKVLSDWLGI